MEVVDCPDLRRSPFHLASSGLGGDQTIVEFGGPPYLLPLVDRSKVYDLVTLVKNIKGYETKKFFTCGAGAGPWPIFDQNCEGIINLSVDVDGTTTNETHVARVLPGSASMQTELVKVPAKETRSALLGNLFLSEGTL